MERDIVLSKEVVALRSRIVPELLPGIGPSDALRPLFRGRQVTGDSIEPDIDTLGIVSFKGNRDAP